MDIRSHILRFRNNQRNKIKGNPSRKIGLTIALLISLLAAGLVISGVYWYSAITEDLPPIVTLENLLESPTGLLLEPTRIYDKTGQVIIWRFENPVIDYRNNVRFTDGTILFYSDLPEIMISAALIAIDPGYFTRSDRFLTNFWDTKLDPIPQILVRDLLLWDEVDHPQHNLRVNLLVDQIVSRYGRMKLLEWFLNSAYFGKQVYGVDQAARIYFGKGAEKLNIAESALLAAVMKYPSLNPYDAPAAVKENQEKILSELVSAGLLSQEEAETASLQELIYADPESSLSPQAPAYVEYIINEANDHVPLDRLLRGGFKIISTLDATLQDELECTTAITLHRVYGEDIAVEESCQASRLLPRYSGTVLSDNDILEIDIVMLDPRSGELLALHGASKEDRSNHVFESKEAGSIITPFIYLNLFTQGFEPASLVWDVPIPGLDYQSDQLHPACSEDCGYQGPVNIRTAMGNDYLSPAVQLWYSLGKNRVNNTLSLFGFSVLGDSCLDCGLFSGLPGLEIVDIAQGFGIFANQGILVGRPIGEGELENKPRSVLRIEEILENGWFIQSPQMEKTVIGDQLTYFINHVLSDEIARSNIADNDVFQIGRPVAIKTGYTPGSLSGWIAGYTPQFVTVVWSGIEEQNAEITTADLQQINTGIWRAITQYVSRDYPIETWQLPDGMETLDVCNPSGLLPTDFCPRIIREPFITGNDPQELDNLYQVFEVNRETGLLASVFTPSEKIEERVFLTIPEIAIDWSIEAGILKPPEIYDLEITSSGEEGFSISSPENFSIVSGLVSIIGSIPEEDFLSARLQYGEGMNPTSWLQVGADINIPVSKKQISRWDTTNLDDGIYALQLVMVKEGRQIDKASLVLSVDNTPPEVSLITDYSDQQIPYEAGGEILFQIENYSDIKKVDVYLDSLLLSSRNSPPYVFPWQLGLGNHDLRIVAFDQANNRGELSISFQVVSSD